MAQARQSAERFHPSEFVNDELEVRGFSRADYVNAMDFKASYVGEFLDGKRRMLPSLAKRTSEFFGFPDDGTIWMNLQTSYDSWVPPRQPTTVEKLAALSGSKLYDIRFEQYLPGHWEVVVGEVEYVPYLGERFNRTCSGFGEALEAAIDAAYEEMMGE